MNPKIRQFVLSHKILYETYFWVTGKKLNRKAVDKEISGYTGNKSPRVDNLMVSLTSFGERIPDLKYTLFSLVNQTLQPQRILVWLAEEEFCYDQLPKDILQFEQYGVEFHFCEDLKSYKKLIPALEKYSDYYIVTADDDIYYRKNWLELLWTTHLKFPSRIVAHICHQIVFSGERKLKPYNNWIDSVARTIPRMFPTGCGGVLYRKTFFYKDIAKKELFLRLTPKADDVWFWFMSVMQGTKIALADNAQCKLISVDIYKEYGLNGKYTLQAENVAQNQNDVQIRNIMEYYGVTDEDLYEMLK